MPPAGPPAVLSEFYEAMTLAEMMGTLVPGDWSCHAECERWQL